MTRLTGRKTLFDQVISKSETMTRSSLILYRSVEFQSLLLKTCGYYDGFREIEDGSETGEGVERRAV